MQKDESVILSEEDADNIHSKSLRKILNTVKRRKVADNRAARLKVTRS